MKKVFAILLGMMLLCLAACGATPGVAQPSALPSAAPSRFVQPPSVAPSPGESAAPTPSPGESETPDPFLEYIATLSDEELLGQMVMIGFSGQNKPSPKATRFLKEKKAGGVLLFGWNIDSFDQTKKLIAAIQEENGTEIPLLIGTDVEGGQVRRFEWRPRLLSAAEMGKKGDPEMVYQQYLRIGKAMRETGFDLDFAPVLDVSKNPEESFLGTRMFGTDGKKTAQLAKEAIRGLQDGGVAALGKHFPGHGNTATDSHKQTPVINDSLETLQSNTFLPFQEAIDANLDAMLVAHISLPALDEENIASLSPAIITDLLRNEMGFSGVVFSDDMRMGGLTRQCSVGQGAVSFILAGGDIVLIGKLEEKQEEVFAALEEAVASGKITRARLEESALRILHMKAKYHPEFAEKIGVVF